MMLCFDEPRGFTEDDRFLLLTLARQCAQALDRARLYEAERKARREAQAANRAKDEFLSVVSHEIRTPPQRDARLGADPGGKAGRARGAP
jgi:GAF domain-containing protein